MYSQSDVVSDVLLDIARSRKSRVQKNVCNAVIWVAVYQIWRAQNDAFWNGQIKSVHKQVYSIKRTVIDRIYCILPRKCSRKDKALVKRVNYGNVISFILF